MKTLFRGAAPQSLNLMPPSRDSKLASPSDARDASRVPRAGGPNILVVEDEALIARDIQHTLRGFGYDVPCIAATGADALHKASLRAPDLVLMDINLRGTLDGVETAVRLQERYAVPVVFLTSHSDDETLARAKEAIPYGFIVKPFSDRVLRTSIEIALARHRRESEMIETANRLAAMNRELVVRSEDGKRESERLLAAAHTDPLTEAANRLLLKEDLEGITHRAKRYGHHYCAAFCDIDRFKSYNDGFGHLAGDNAIREVAGAIRKCLRRGDGFYRFGGDEFLVLLPEQSLATAKECMDRVRAAVAGLSLAADGGVLVRPVTLSVGVAALRSTPDGDATQSWLRRADAALYRAKARGGNAVETESEEQPD